MAHDRLLADLTVGVMGSGTDPHEELSAGVGRLLAELEVNLLTGGGRGVMEAVSRSYLSARRGRGISIGVIPCEEGDPARPKRGYPNAFVELPIYTHLPFSGDRGQDPLSRNHINILTCAAIVVLPGTAGTAAEAALALRYERPTVIHAPGASLASHFPRELPRAADTAEVRRFPLKYLRDVRADR